LYFGRLIIFETAMVFWYAYLYCKQHWYFQHIFGALYARIPNAKHVHSAFILF
jgi:hypothetical protein